MMASKPCPQCLIGTRVERMNRETGTPFIGCSQWPVCTWTMPLPADEVMRRAGATPLPGLEGL
jgi:ssDNA-binding Zn-finger/Zn-ribbon topoisomerase 1